MNKTKYKELSNRQRLIAKCMLAYAEENFLNVNCSITEERHESICGVINIDGTAIGVEFVGDNPDE